MKLINFVQHLIRLYKMGTVSKITDAQLWEVMEKACGNFHEAQRIMKKSLGIEMTVPGIAFRANKDKEKLQDCKDRIVTMAEGVLVKSLQSDNERIAIDAAKHITVKHRKSKEDWNDEVDVNIKGAKIVWGGEK